MLAQHLHGPGIEIDDALAAVSLGVALLHLVGDRDKCPANGQPAGFEIHIAPSQPEHLAPPHPGVRAEVPRGEVA